MTYGTTEQGLQQYLHVVDSNNVSNDDTMPRKPPFPSRQWKQCELSCAEAVVLVASHLSLVE